MYVTNLLIYPSIYSRSIVVVQEVRVVFPCTSSLKVFQRTPQESCWILPAFLYHSMQTVLTGYLIFFLSFSLCLSFVSLCCRVSSLLPLCNTPTTCGNRSSQNSLLDDATIISTIRPNNNNINHLIHTTEADKQDLNEALHWFPSLINTECSLYLWSFHILQHTPFPIHWFFFFFFVSPFCLATPPCGLIVLCGELVTNESLFLLLAKPGN